MSKNAHREKKQKNVKNHTSLADLLQFLIVILYTP